MDKRLLDIAEDMREYHKKRPNRIGTDEMWDKMPISILVQHGRARRMAEEAGMRIIYNEAEKQYELVNIE